MMQLRRLDLCIKCECNVRLCGRMMCMFSMSQLSMVVKAKILNNDFVKRGYAVAHVRPTQVQYKAVTPRTPSFVVQFRLGSFEGWQDWKVFIETPIVLLPLPLL